MGIAASRGESVTTDGVSVQQPLMQPPAAPGPFMGTVGYLSLKGDGAAGADGGRESSGPMSMIDSWLNMPGKQRLLRLAQKVAPIWSIQKQADKLDRAYRAQIHALTMAGEHGKVSELREEHHFELSEYLDLTNEIRTKRMLRLAKKYYIPTDQYEQSMNVGQWGNSWLGEAALDALAAQIDQKWRERWEFRMKIVSPIITLLVGLVGALVGLVSVLLKAR